MQTPNASAINQAWLTQKRRALTYLRSTLDLSAIQDRPGDSLPFDITPGSGLDESGNIAFPVYPAPGAAAIDVIKFTVPPGYFAVVRFLAINHFGGNFIDGSGNVIWRVLKNGAAIRGLNRQTAQIGIWGVPSDVKIYCEENSIIEVTAEVPAAAIQPPPPTSTTGARMDGYFYPIMLLQGAQ